MGFRSQFESLVQFHQRFQNRADIYMVYGKEAFPEESAWPAPALDGQTIRAPRTEDQRLALVERFARDIGDEIDFLVDDLANTMMGAYDAYPFRVFAIAPDGTIAVPSAKGAAGFGPTLERIARWLEAPTKETEAE